MIRSLVFLDPSGLHQMAFEGASLSFGREPGNDVLLDDPLVSRHHALLELRGETTWIRDLGSRKNGVWINGKRIDAPAVLLNRDVFTIGDARIRFIQVASTWRSSELGLLSGYQPAHATPRA
jgi:pSer/pThr/pTyr-binding forkhead associated (FHA) protein